MYSKSVAPEMQNNGIAYSVDEYNELIAKTQATVTDRVTLPNGNELIALRYIVGDDANYLYFEVMGWRWWRWRHVDALLPMTYGDQFVKTVDGSIGIGYYMPITSVWYTSLGTGDVVQWAEINTATQESVNMEVLRLENAELKSRLVNTNKILREALYATGENNGTSMGV